MRLIFYMFIHIGKPYKYGRSLTIFFLSGIWVQVLKAYYGSNFLANFTQCCLVPFLSSKWEHRACIAVQIND